MSPVALVATRTGENTMSFWNIVELVILLSSLVLLVIGFNKNNRKILLVAWVCLFVAFT